MTADSALLERVRKLLAKAEAQGVTPAEAEAFTAKAAELIARYGIDRALLAAETPGTDQPANRIIDVPNPWANVRAHLLAGIASAMRCQCVQIPTARGGSRIHVFGYAADLERAELLYTSLLVQMAHGLAATLVPLALAARAPGGAAGCSVMPALSSAAFVPPNSGPPPKPTMNATVPGRVQPWCSPTGPR
jgi:hypothetical protein